MNKEEKGKTLGEYQKKIKDLEERIAIMETTDSELCADLEHWKKVAAGLKGSNKKLGKELSRCRSLLDEADELNEKRASIISEKEKAINGLQSQVQELAAKNAELVSKMNANQDLINKLELTVAELKTPWWKKIF